MQCDTIRYALQLEMLERHDDLGEDAASALLRAELELAQNAGLFDALTPEDFAVDAISRSTPQEGVTRYAVELLLQERHAGLDDDAAAGLLHRAFADALNASYFLRACTDDLIGVTLLSRTPAAVPSAA